MSFFSPFRKQERLLRHTYHLFQSKKKKLSEGSQQKILEQMRLLQQALGNKDVVSSKEEASQLEKLSTQLLTKTSFEKIRTFILSLAGALALAVLIRQVWFELYKIPTGSMRPTLMEQDHLLVSKTTFGINRPLSRDHILFDPDLVQRNGIFIFTGEGMDIRDVDTMYFYLFPGKKIYVKRLMGKPGDTLYFYGGLLYGIDKEGKDISSELQSERLAHIDHVPFLQFEGKVSTGTQADRGIYSPIFLRQMNMPVAKLSVLPSNQVTGELLVPSPVKSYSDLWGIGNFGMARIVSQEMAKRWASDSSSLIPAPFYLEILHTPSLQGGTIEKDIRGRLRPHVRLHSSFVPLDEEHMKKLFSNLYTVRFTVQKGIAHAYGLPSAFINSPLLPKIPGIPDGTYEFYYGKGYKIGFQGLSSPLQEDHPLYNDTPERIQLLYNLGMEFDVRFSPNTRHTPFFPLRYVYFRNGDLYAMGEPLFSKEDPLLQSFIETEKKKSTPFLDKGAPLLADGTLDVEFIRANGLQVPEKMYLALGDNHAVSGDSREFGFVPQENLRGAPDWIFWPAGPRFGHPNQPPYPFINLPRVLVWTTALLCIGGSLIWRKKRNKLPRF